MAGNNQQNKQQSGGNSPQQQQGGKPAESKQENSRVAVTFTKPWHRYVRGDIAGFSKDEAERLVKKNVAVEGTELPAPAKEEGDEPAA